MASGISFSSVQIDLNPNSGLPGLQGGFSGFPGLTGDPALGRLTSLSPGFGLNPSMQMPATSSLGATQGLASQQMLLTEMMMMLLQLMTNGTSGSAAQGLDSGSSGGGAASSIPSTTGSSGGGSSAAGDSGASFATSGGATSGAAGSVDMAKSYLGNSAISLKGKLKNYSAAGGTGNDCADFVSAILANTQGFQKKGGDASVATFKQDLVQQGWRKVDKAQSKAGDVVIFNGSQHTELVTKDGGKEAIGSNGGATNQTIKTDSLSWGTQEFYHKG